jgi:hypothetical protein
MMTTFAMPSDGPTSEMLGAALVMFGNRIGIEWVDHQPGTTFVILTYEDDQGAAIRHRIREAAPAVELISTISI